MGSNLGRNMGLSAVDSIKPGIEDTNRNAAKGIEEITKFRESLDKNLDLFLSNINDLFHKINKKSDTVLGTIDSMVSSYLEFIAVFVQIIVVFSFVSGFAVVFAKKATHRSKSNRTQKTRSSNSFVSFIVSMRYFALFLCILLTILIVYLYMTGMPILQIIQMSGVIWVLIFFVLTVTLVRKIYRFLFIEFNRKTYSKRDKNNWRKTILIIICSILITIMFTFLITFVNSILLRRTVLKANMTVSDMTELKINSNGLSCSPLFTEINGLCYAFHRGPSTADQAHKSCKELKASTDLPIIRNKADLDAAVLLAKHYNIKEFWVIFKFV